MTGEPLLLSLLIYPSTEIFKEEPVAHTPTPLLLHHRKGFFISSFPQVVFCTRPGLVQV